MTTQLSQPTEWNDTVDTIFRTEFSNLCRLAGRLLAPAVAEEAVQEAFVKFAALRSCPRLGSETAYLRSIVLNEARSMLRRRQVDDRYLQRRRVVDESEGVVDIVIAAGEQQALRHRIDRLSPRQRQVVELRFLHQLSEREIAERLDISTGSVKTHCSRALQAMRFALTAEKDDAA